MAQFNERRAGSGALSGGMAGAQSGPWGAAIGAVAGGLLGGFTGQGSNSVQERLDMMLSRRLGQIEQFSQRMAANRQRLLDRTQALQNLAYTRFAANLEAQFAARGKQVTGGAYQSGLGKEAAMKQAELTQYEADIARQDELAKQNQIAAAYGSWGTSSAAFNQAEYENERKADQAEAVSVGQAAQALVPMAAKGLSGMMAKRRAGLNASTGSFGSSMAPIARREPAVFMSNYRPRKIDLPIRMPASQENWPTPVVY